MSGSRMDFNDYTNGWDYSGISGINGFGIHHDFSSAPGLGSFGYQTLLTDGMNGPAAMRQLYMDNQAGAVMDQVFRAAGYSSMHDIGFRQMANGQGWYGTPQLWNPYGCSRYW
jgi:hypothetical protein